MPSCRPQTLTVKAGTAQLELRDGWQADARVPRVPGHRHRERPGARARRRRRAAAWSIALVDDRGRRRRAARRATLEALRVPLPKPERATVGGLRGTGYTALSLRGVSGLADIYTFQHGRAAC